MNSFITTTRNDNVENSYKFYKINETGSFTMKLLTEQAKVKVARGEIIGRKETLLWTSELEKKYSNILKPYNKLFYLAEINDGVSTETYIIDMPYGLIKAISDGLRQDKEKERDKRKRIIDVRVESVEGQYFPNYTVKIGRVVENSEEEIKNNTKELVDIISRLVDRYMSNTTSYINNQEGLNSTDNNTKGYNTDIDDCPF